jgi:hypothetical protein
MYNEYSEYMFWRNPFRGPQSLQTLSLSHDPYMSEGIYSRYHE